METLQQEKNYQEAEFDCHRRRYDDMTTWLAEVLDGSMRTEFSYHFDGQELYGEDGGALRPIFEDGITEADKISQSNPNLSFESRRRRIELYGEFEDMIAMAKDELPSMDASFLAYPNTADNEAEPANTIVITSDFPPELMDATEDVGGYNVSRKQTMLRVITKNEDGTLTMYSQSLDGSDRQALEAIYEEFGFRPEPGELLGQRMALKLESDAQDTLTDRLTGVYDRSLEARDGIKRYAGRTPADMTNTYQFVRNQTDLLDAFMDSDDESLHYGLAAAITERFDNRHARFTYQTEDKHRPKGVDPVLAEIFNAALVAREAGKTYSGCGISVGPEGEISIQAQLQAAGYGNKTTKETEYEFDKEMYCKTCQNPPEEDEDKKMCGPCGFCEDCDAEMRHKTNLQAINAWLN